ncbi:hypothetical protein [Terriglobus roseus]|uniref:Uncharacterized protein n=1 Tax=Terriglobus roseus TaxID=392734 RepID=A0A1G7QPL7_9BACT|nr:hypothetical protein [Terriglobus roseus]SDG00487.1 hypothetical protein SAMN05444167_3951 [Terriglobus roseus]
MNNVISITTGLAHRITRTPDEIGAEISLLIKLRNLIPPVTAFGDSNIEGIDAQIAVLRERMSVKGIVEEWDDDHHVQSAGVFAAEWLSGEGEAPSSGWLDLVGDEDGWMN